jgi:hypothetical protein
MEKTEIIKLERCFIEKDGNVIRVYLYDFADNEAGGRILIKTIYPEDLYTLYKWAKEIFQSINKAKDCYNCSKWDACKQLDGDGRKIRDECRKEGYKLWHPRYEL